jgi:arylsulfatase A-like enzyme
MRALANAFVACALIVLAGCAAEPDGEWPPNFIVILADDLGYADTGAYGSTRNETPHLDRLAREGLRFTDFHSNGPMCTPTRAALLTGRYQNRLGRAFESPLGADDKGLPLDQVTIAEALAEAGYVSGAYGKWHLGRFPPYLPTSHGFEEFWGLGSGDGDHHSHIDRSGRKDWWHNDQTEMEEGYSVELITDHSVAFIERNKDRPFFLYVAHLAIHFPWQGPGDEGYREEGGDYHNLTKLGYFEEDKDPSGKVKEMVESVDGSAGRIVESVKANGLAEDTLIVFTSDNGGYLTYRGGYHNISSNGPLRGQKTEVYEGGIRVPTIAWWPQRIAPGVTDDLAASFDLFPTFLELAGLGERADLKLDGVSLAPLLLDRGALPDRTLFWRMRDRKAVRQGPWKLVAVGEAAPELYNLAEDIGESSDLSAQRPELAGRLLSELQAWESDVEPKSVPATGAAEQH